MINGTGNDSLYGKNSLYIEYLQPSAIVLRNNGMQFID